MTEFAVPKKPVFRKVPSKTPDYNPDKERHVDHTFIVQKADRSAGNTIDVGGKQIKLNKEGRAFIKDEALAREIQTEHRFDMAVTRMRTPSVSDRGHRYHFGQMPAMPWHKYDEDGRRIEDGEREVKSGQEDTALDSGGRLRPGSGGSNCFETAGEETPPPEPKG